VGGWLGEGGELVAVGKLLMGLSRWGQSRDAEGRHPAARPGLGTWVGARVASPRCPILRPGSSSVFGTPATRQFRAGSPLARRGRGIRLGSRAWARRMSKGPCSQEDWRRGAGSEV